MQRAAAEGNCASPGEGVGTAKREQAAIDVRRAGVAVAGGERERAEAGLDQPAGIAGADTACKRDVLAVGVDRDGTAAVPKPGRIIGGVAGRVLQRAATEGERAAPGKRIGIAERKQTAIDAREAGVAVAAGDCERAAADFYDCSRAAEDARVGRGIAAVEYQRAVVEETAGATEQNATGAAGADLERTPRIQIDRAGGGPRECAPHRHEAAVQGERAAAYIPDQGGLADGDRSAGDRDGAVALESVGA